jgi:hypothetical protein
MIVTLNANSVPTPQVVTQFVQIANQVPVGAAGFQVGETVGVVAKLNRNSVRLDLSTRYGSGSVGVGTGLGITAGAGLTVSVAAGHAVIGTIVEMAETSTVAVPASVRSYLFLISNGSISVQTSSNAAPQNSCYIGSVLADAANVVSIDTSGVGYLRNGVLWRQTSDAAAPTDSPASSMILFTRTNAGTYVWDGARHLALVPASVINPDGHQKLGFFGAAPVAKTAVADPPALTSPSTLSSTYSQSQVQALRDDLAALRSQVANLTDALQALGLI